MSRVPLKYAIVVVYLKYLNISWSDLFEAAKLQYGPKKNKSIQR